MTSRQTLSRYGGEWTFSAKSLQIMPKNKRCRRNECSVATDECEDAFDTFKSDTLPHGEIHQSHRPVQLQAGSENTNGRESLDNSKVISQEASEDTNDTKANDNSKANSLTASEDINARKSQYDSKVPNLAASEDVNDRKAQDNSKITIQSASNDTNAIKAKDNSKANSQVASEDTNDSKITSLAASDDTNGRKSLENSKVTSLAASEDVNDRKSLENSKVTSLRGRDSAVVDYRHHEKFVKLGEHKNAAKSRDNFRNSNSDIQDMVCPAKRTDVARVSENQTQESCNVKNDDSNVSDSGSMESNEKSEQEIVENNADVHNVVSQKKFCTSPFLSYDDDVLRGCQGRDEGDTEGNGIINKEGGSYLLENRKIADDYSDVSGEITFSPDEATTSYLSKREKNGPPLFTHKYPAPPSSPVKKSHINRASKPRIKKEVSPFNDKDDQMRSSSCPDKACTRKFEPPEASDRLSRPCKYPVPPSSPMKKFKVYRASRTRLPKEHFTFISKNEELRSPLVEESDGIIPLKGGPPSSDAPDVFIASSDSSQMVTFSGSSSESELNKLIDFNKVSHTSDEQQSTGAICNSKQMSSTETDIHRTLRRQDNFVVTAAMPETTPFHPLGASAVVLGPISSLKETSGKTEDNKSLFTNENEVVSSLFKPKLPVARRLEFDQSNSSRSVLSSLSALECPEKVLQSKAKKRRQCQTESPDAAQRRPQLDDPSRETRIKLESKMIKGVKRVSFAPEVEILGSSPPKETVLDPRTARDFEKSQYKNTTRNRGLKAEASNSSSDYDSEKNEGSVSTNRSNISYVHQLYYQSSASFRDMFADSKTIRAREEMMRREFSRKPSKVDSSFDESLHQKPVTDQRVWDTRSHMSAPLMSLSNDPLSSSDSRDEHIRERQQITSTSSLPPPLPPPDLLAPTLFKRRIGHGIPPVQGKLSPSAVRHQDNPSKICSATAQHQQDRMTNVARANKY